ncbi:related to Probable proline--tRNA ligase, mitochondrial [Saccharomycodes ludwigii]|uniref:proline--tRNA ligase n=1 Tax=Saccharomycodes ludwigii TaxID=36035 RepID=A0A376B7E5_9ASCO|nr:related to Probable proline--tRNA ligase, mitochondrial [Saccharomycodes ludwigii]
MRSLKTTAIKLSYISSKRSYCHQFINPNFDSKATKSGGGNNTNDLLTNLGYIYQLPTAGLLHYLPLGLRTVKKIGDIIRKNLNNSIDANEFPVNEVSLSSISPTSLWVKTGRYPNDEVFTLNKNGDKNAKFLLVPTCEEEITAMMKPYLKSYKNLPQIVYQISRKYRYEKRPRGGILRGREFLMKDAYSFHVNERDALKCFDMMKSKYDLIFQAFKIPYVSAWADSGEIGGDRSMEYHYLHEIGEDKLMICDECGIASNIEKCQSTPVGKGQFKDPVEVTWCLNKEGDTLIGIYYPGTHELDPRRVVEAYGGEDLDLDTINMPNEKVLLKYQRENEDIMLASMVRLMDCRLHPRSNLPDFPLSKYSKFQFVTIDEVDLCFSKVGDVCEHCGTGHLRMEKSIEVGHIFYLGDKYSKPLDLKYVSKDNAQEVVKMGCYGIGLSRVLGSIAELTKDDIGLRWPSTIAPYTVSFVTPPNIHDDTSLLREIEHLKNNNSTNTSDDWLFDLRKDISLGKKINTSHAAGIPICCIIGRKSWPYIELEIRGKRYSNTWEKAYEMEGNGSKFDWVSKGEKASTNSKNRTFEKHLVHKDDLNSVLAILLKDL